MSAYVYTATSYINEVHERLRLVTKQRDDLRVTCEMVTKCLMDLAPYPPEVAIGAIAIVDIAREAIKAAEAVKENV